jgi:multidrug efflux system membrane fusion protein
MDETTDKKNTADSHDSPASAPDSNPGKRGRQRIWLIVVLLLLGGAFFLIQRRGQGESKTPKAPPPPAALPVTTTITRKGNIGVYVNALGSVTPIFTVTITSRVDGQLISVNYREGQMVHQGDVLAEIDPRPFQAQLTQAQGQYERDIALLENAKIDLNRFQIAYSKNAIPQQQLATQVALVHQLEGTVKNDLGLIESAKVQLVYCKITSPITGRVGLRLVDPGNVVHAADTTGMLVITQLQPITVVFTVAEDSIPQIQQHLRKGNRLVVEAWDRSQTKKLGTGTLLTIDNEIDTTTGTVKLKATFNNNNDALFPNQFVNARLLVNMQRGVILVPTAAIQRNAQGAFVYVIKPDQTASMQTVSVGTIDGNMAAVEGLNEGDVVAVDGFDKLQNGVKVVARNAPGAANGGTGQ